MEQEVSLKILLPKNTAALTDLVPALLAVAVSFDLLF